MMSTIQSNGKPNSNNIWPSGMKRKETFIQITVTVQVNTTITHLKYSCLYPIDIVGNSAANATSDVACDFFAGNQKCPLTELLTVLKGLS